LKPLGVTIPKKLAAISVLGPIRDGSLFPDDLELHLFGRGLIEKNNPDLEITWFISWKSEWAHSYPSANRTRLFILNPDGSPELKYSHPSLDHGAMLNLMMKDVDGSFDYVLVMDPDCFLVGKNGLQEHVNRMGSSGIAISGTSYGMQAPKSFFRDFPTVFALVIDCALVDIRALDFRPSKWSSETTVGIQDRGIKASIISLKNQTRRVPRFVIGRILGGLLGVHDPVRWWGFLSEFRQGNKNFQQKLVFQKNPNHPDNPGDPNYLDNPGNPNNSDNPDNSKNSENPNNYNDANSQSATQNQ
jgi:hypothetical protein